MKKFFMFLILYVCMLLQAAGQNTYSFKHINAQEGMSNDFILDMAIDGQSFVWSATESGLNKWTGNENIVYKENNSPIVSNELTSLYYDTPTNMLWIGSRASGISLFDCHTQQFRNLTTKNGLSANDVSDIMPADEEGIWIVYLGGKIDRYDKSADSITARYNKENIPDLKGRNRCCCDDYNGSLYVGHVGNGMSVVNLKDKTVKNYRHDARNPKSLPGNNVRSIYIDHLKNVWVGTNGGLALFNSITEEFINFRHDNTDIHSLVGDNIHWVTEMQDETLWIASDLGGISILDLHNFEKADIKDLSFNNITPANSNLSSPNTRIILEDKFHNVWIGNYSTGIDFLSHAQSNFQVIPYFSEVNDKKAMNHIYGIKANEDGSLWLGGENRLSLYKDHKIIKDWDISKYMSRAYSVIYIIEKDSEGNIWLGINDEGVICYNPRTDSFKHLDLGADNLDIHAFYEDKQGQMWIGSEEGIYIHRQGTIKKADIPEWKNWNPIIYAITKDDQQKTWVGTLGAGLYILDEKDNKELKHFYEGWKLDSSHINQIYKDRKGGLWIATYNGLGYVEDTNHPEQIKIYNEQQGLADCHIRAIQQDKQGNIWVSTYTGIACWNAYQQTFYNYDYNDGVPLGGFVESSSAMTPDGTLFFSSPHGVCYFHPQLMKNDKTVSPIEIISCESFSKQATGRNFEIAVPDDKGIVRLPYNQNTFRITFTVADYSQNGQVDYAYIMDGQDKSWYYTKKDNTITFHNIAPGNYTFKVKARLKNNDWDEKNIASMHIIVSPPLWATWYAKTIYILLVLFIMYFIFRSYKKRLLLKSSLEIEKNSRETERRSRQKEQELNNERFRFYTNIAHELRTPLTLIIGPLEDLKDDKNLTRYRTKVQTIHRSAVQLLNLINQLMEFRKTETQNRQLAVSKGNLGNLVTEIGLRYKELNRNSRVEFHIEVEPLKKVIYFDAEVITIILNNLLSNAIKYTPNGQISLSMHPVKVNGTDYTEIVVADTGYGIDAEALPHIYDRYYQAKGKHQASGTGIGLALVKSLVTLHHGTLDVESATEKGTTFFFRIPTDDTYPEALHKENKEIELPNMEEKMEEDEETDTRPILLVVEDNADIREYIAQELQDNYKILQGRNGKEGLSLALKYTPNIIVSDIMMPEMNGIELCKNVKGNMNTSHIPIILLTAKDSIQDKEEGYDNGADSYLTKPFSAKLLKSRIRNLLETRKQLAKQIVANVPIPAIDAENQVNVASHPQLSKLDETFLSKLTSLVEDNLDEEKIDVTFMTDRMNMSYSSFYRKVKALTELSPNEFVRKIKLKNSVRLILTGEYNISEAASMTGFNNMAHFRDCFKEEFGMSPSEYLKQHRSGSQSI